MDLQFKTRIKDSIHGMINITEQELKIIKDVNFQRLRWVSQLGAVQLVYPSATHTRFSHSLGVLQNVTKFAQEIDATKEEDKRIFKNYLPELRIAALIHHLGEPPFDRLFEDYYPDVISKLESESIEIARSICESVGADWNIINLILRGKSGRKNHEGEFKPLFQLINSVVNADRVDYLIRDSMESGVKYGLIDDRIYRCFILDENELFIKQNELNVIESFFSSYYQIKNAVYDHEYVRSALCLIRGAMRGIKNPLEVLLNEEENKWRIKTDEEFLQKLSKYDSDSIFNYKTDNLPKVIYSLEYYALKQIFREKKLLSEFENLRLKINDVEEELKKVLNLKSLYFDVVAVSSFKEDLRVRSPDGSYTSLWDSSRLLKQWKDYFSEQWKIYIMSYDDEANIIKELSNIFDFLKFNSNLYLPDNKITKNLLSLGNIFEEAKDIVYVQSKKTQPLKYQIQSKVKSLTDERKKILYILYQKNEASAEDISKDLNKNRATICILLRKLEKDDLVQKKRRGKKMFYSIKKDILWMFDRELLKELDRT